MDGASEFQVMEQSSDKFEQFADDAKKQVEAARERGNDSGKQQRKEKKQEEEKDDWRADLYEGMAKGFELRGRLGQFFKRWLKANGKLDDYEQDDGGSVGKLARKSAYRKTWAALQYENVQKEKVKKEEFEIKEGTTGSFYTFGGLVIKYGGWSWGPAVIGAKNTAMSCTLLGGKWVKVDVHKTRNNKQNQATENRSMKQKQHTEHKNDTSENRKQNQETAKQQISKQQNNKQQNNQQQNNEQQNRKQNGEHNTTNSKTETETEP